MFFYDSRFSNQRSVIRSSIFALLIGFMLFLSAGRVISLGDHTTMPIFFSFLMWILLSTFFSRPSFGLFFTTLFTIEALWFFSSHQTFKSDFNWHFFEWLLFSLMGLNVCFSREVYCWVYRCPIYDEDFAIRSYTTNEEQKGFIQGEEQFIRTFRLAPMPQAIIRILDDQYVEVNESFAHFLGYSRDELVGKTSLEFKLSESPEVRSELNRNLHNRGRVRNFPAVIITKLGERHSVEISANQIELDGYECSLSTIIDVTEQKKAEKALKESEQKYRELFEAMQEYFFIVEPLMDTEGYPIDWRYLEVNPPVQRLMKRSREQLIGHTYSEMVSYPSQEWISILGEVAQTQIPVNREIFSPYSKRWFYLTAYSPRRGQAAALYSDITDRKRFEIALQESERKFSSAFDMAPFSTALLKWPSGLLVEVNDAWCRLMGFSRQDAIGKTSAELGLFPNIENRKALYEELTQGGAVRDFEVTIRTRFGEIRTGPTSMTLIEIGGEKYAIGTFVDLTEQRRIEEACRKSEQKFLSIHDHAPFAIALLELPGSQIIEVNTAWEQTFGFTRSETLGQSLASLGTLIDLKDYSRMLLKLEETGLVRNWELAFLKKGGERRIASFSFDRLALDRQKVYLGTAIDITEQKRAEEALKSREAELREAQRIGGIGSWSWDVEVDRVTWSDECYRIVGLDRHLPEPDFQREHQKLYTPESFKRLGQAVDCILHTGSSYELELELIRPNGEKRWVMARGEVDRLSSLGKVVRIRGTLQDITESKLFHAALQANEERTRLILENMSEGLMLFDSNRNLIYQNPASLRIHGFEPQNQGQIQNENVSTTWKAWDDTNRPITFDEWPISRVFRRERFKDQILRVQRVETGQEFYGSYNGSPIFDSHGNLILGFITIREITKQVRATGELRKSEERFRMYTEAMPQGAFIADPNGSITYHNQHFYHYVGAKEKEKIGEWKWKETSIIHPDDLNRTIETWTHSLRTGESYHIIYRLRRADGEYRWHLGRAIPVRDSTGQILQWLGTNTDIHEQKQTATELEKAVKARDEFLSIASHELKTPLASLSLQAQLLNKGIKNGRPDAYAPEKVNRMVFQTDRQVSRLVRLVDDMLDVSRIESGKFMIKPEKTSFSDIVKDVIDRLKSQMLACGTEPILEYLETIEGFWDPFRLEQVVTNLMTNAMRYGNGKPIMIRVESSGVNRLQLSVRDQGMGISKEDQERIFDRFERAVSASKISGLGLGLFISREIVKLHGGWMWVESELERGATFFVELPLWPEEEETKSKQIA